MGLQLRSPLVIGAAAPLSEDIDNIKKMEDFGAAAVVLHSFFEEQIKQERLSRTGGFSRWFRRISQPYSQSQRNGRYSHYCQSQR
jgi:dihydroorotate dehydrogenase